jgi:hypothetical protein
VIDAQDRVINHQPRAKNAQPTNIWRFGNFPIIGQLSSLPDNREYSPR